jgi:heme-degrading monooxygenase HmoA
MMTIVTHVHLKEGAGRDWDAAMRTRLTTAKTRPGWIGGQLLRPADKEDRRVIVGTWKSHADWEAWHHDPKFAETRQQLDGLVRAPDEHWWHDVVLDVRKSAAPARPAARPPRKTGAKRKAKGSRRRRAR